MDTRIPRLQSLLYWNPDVKTNQDGKAQVSFYAADNVGDFIVDVEGVSVNGKPFVISLSFEVVHQLANN